MLNIRNRILRREYRNFYWAVTWLITLVCNLRCKYCYVAPGAKHPDARKALAKIISMRPKHLCISGGEPTLVPGFPALMKELREALPACDVVLNSNATLPDRVLEVLPYVSTLAFSIDGVGAVNKELRGVDGDLLLGTLERLIRKQVETGNRFRIAVVPVVVMDNFRQMHLLFDRVEALYKKYRNDMAIDVKPMHPYDQPMTVVYRPEIYREFMNLRAQWLAKYTIRLNIRGFGELTPLAEQGAKQSISCFRQYFSALVNGEGEVSVCKPAKFYDYYHDRFFRGGLREKARAAAGACRNLLLSHYCPTCPFPCEHMEFLSEPLAMGRASDIIRWAGEHRLPMGAEEDAEAFRFIKRHLNRDFIIDVGSR
jgi:MoaA/NifB/PqqE/SkfB family radical SAM enzyme